jgi:4-amino-4-deoxy-L-arabinose transferase-like glycosyltransferase
MRRHWATTILLLILAAAAMLRLVSLDRVPPGLHVDEATNAWNASTLLETGKDQHGVSWPIFYTRAFGQSHSPAYQYTLLPFQALGGMNVRTTRLPAALGGVLTVFLLYLVGRRLFDRTTGLGAAGMLAVNPWHVQMSRFGHEASLSPLAVTACVAALLWANLPLDDDDRRRPRAAAAAFAGLVTGLSCYGYYTLRLFLPVFLVGAVLVTWPAWWARLQSRESRLAIAALVIAGAATFGPLLWAHLTDPEIGKRGAVVGWLWTPSDTALDIVTKVARRYAAHYGPDFLFISGDRYPGNAPPNGVGLFHWYDLPPLVVGLAVLGRRVPRSRAARVALLWLALYPLADLLNPHVSPHSLRSLPGLCGIVLVAAVGAVGAARVAGRWRRGRLALGCAAACAVVASNARFITLYFVNFAEQKYHDHASAPDILEAAGWLRGRLDGVDAVFVTGYATHPEIFTLVGLDYDPHQWFRDTREVIQGPLPNGAYAFEEIPVRIGKLHFMLGPFGNSGLDELQRNQRKDHVLLVVRPGELGLQNIARPVYEVRDPRGVSVLLVFDVTI